MSGTAARLGLTSKRKEAVLFSPPDKLEVTYVFSLKHRGVYVCQWRCTTCANLRTKAPHLGTVPVISTKNGLHVHDPANPANAPHFCDPESTPSVEAYQQHREALIDLQQSRKRPSDAYDHAQKKIAKLPNPEIEQKFPTFANVKTSMYRAYNQAFPVVPGIKDIPPELMLTYRGSVAPPDPLHPHHNEKLIIYSRPDPPTLYFACPDDLESLFHSEHWDLDGTFKVRPNGPPKFAQLYVVLGFKNGEGSAAFHALTPDRKKPTYIQMFGYLRSSLETRFGSIGAIRFAHCDYEEAVYLTFKEVFPEVRIVGCLFHRAKALNGNLADRGLTPVYCRSPKWGYDQEQYAAVPQWIRRLTALPMLPEAYVEPAFYRLLQKPPLTLDPFVDGRLAEFSKYFTEEWARPSMLALTNQYDNPGRRTTNDLEGYNNRVQHKYQVNRPRFNVFLVKFRDLHHATLVRRAQLARGAPPAPRLPQYVENERRIAEEKAYIGVRLSQLSSPADIDKEILAYLDRIQHCIGNHPVMK